MPSRIEASDVTKDLALEGLSLAVIQTKLEERGLGSLLPLSAPYTKENEDYLTTEFTDLHR